MLKQLLLDFLAKILETVVVFLVDIALLAAGQRGRLAW